ncbi:MAG TPA: PEP-CTERM sorting domain-containing protein, partial [Tepidisphaeraceae bacterium]|nr:PEP-CTERM sorting domain-containing protein [Tepidisphaeraceae bacterium]
NSVGTLTEYVGFNTIGLYNQSGGSNTFGVLGLGENSGSTGTYVLSGSASISGAGEVIGDFSAPGVFVQSGGTNNLDFAGEYVDLGLNTQSTGTYFLIAGSLTSGVESVGYSGMGDFNQTGGTNTMGAAGTLYVGQNSTATGTYLLSGTASLSVGNEYVGSSGVGTFNQSGGRNTIAGTFSIGSLGRYNLTGGTLTVMGGGIVNAGGSLIIQSAGQLNLADSTLLVNYKAGSDPITSIVSYLASGYNNGTWNGVGINSSTVAGLNASQGALVYAIGYADGADGITGVPSGEIEILPTLAGDAKLQGTVNFGDFQLLAEYFGHTGTTWDEGDFTYNGTTNFGDFQLLAQNFGANSSALTAAEFSGLNSFAAQFGDQILANPDGVGFELVSVPEPASAALLTAAGALLLSRRSRSKRRHQRHPLLTQDR